jgi:hypothetical protein
VNCCAFLAWRLSSQGASIHFRSNGYEFRQPEDGDIYTILKYLALVYPQRADAPEAPLDDASFKIVFTPSPRAFRDAGWMQARLLGPDVLPVPAGGADPAPNPPAGDPPKPEPVKTSITVVEKISAETPANVTVLDQTALQQSPGTNLDDRLRDVPGFSLFRRSSSLVANPTTQGISLRGIGSSGASRTLVLWDGIPANDPFGGWVYWTQFVPGRNRARRDLPRRRHQHLRRPRHERRHRHLLPPARDPARAGRIRVRQRNTHDISAGFSEAWSRLAISGAARAFTTDGYYIVPESIRGAADTRANVQFVTGDVRIDHYTSPAICSSKPACWPKSGRTAPCSPTIPPAMGTVSLRYVREFTSDSFSLLGFHTQEGFHSTFDSVSADRNTDRLSYTADRPQPCRRRRGPVAASRSQMEPAGRRRRVSRRRHQHGPSRAHRPPRRRRHAVAARRLRAGDATFGWVKLFAGVRHSFAGEGSQFLSPKRRLRRRQEAPARPRQRLSQFPRPTLNELYRTFKAGNTTTQANPALVPETLWGAEAGFDWVGETSTFRVTGYRNALDNLITNVTLSSSPTAIVRQRANAAAALSRGVEAEFRQHLGNFTGELKYLYVESRYVTGYRVAQIPKHQGTAQLTWQRGGTLASAGPAQPTPISSTTT